MSAPARDSTEARRCLRFGWTSLALWALFGLALEAAHGFKLAVYLDDALRHTLLRLSHAHGVVLALVVLVYGRGAPAASVGRLLRAGALVVPAGFALSAIAPHEGDPGWPVALVPIGGALLVIGFGRAAAQAWRSPP